MIEEIKQLILDLVWMRGFLICGLKLIFGDGIGQRGERLGFFVYV